MHEIIPLFSTPLYYSNIGNINFTDISEFAKVQTFPFNSNLSITNSSNLIDELPFLKKEIVSHVNMFFFNKLEIEENFQYYFPDSWFVKLEPGGNSVFHNHGNSLYSGVVYIDVDENCGDIVFERLDKASWPAIIIEIPYKKFNIFNSLNYSIKPKIGDIIIFPSYLYHQVTTNLSDKIRYSFAFNILPLKYTCNTSGMKV